MIKNPHYFPDLILLSCLHNIWQFSDVVFPPSCHGFIWSAPILMAGIVLQHNYIEAHTTTGVVPCELANLKMDLGQNRWLGLIKEASRKDIN